MKKNSFIFFLIFFFQKFFKKNIPKMKEKLNQLIRLFYLLHHHQYNSRPGQAGLIFLSPFKKQTF